MNPGGGIGLLVLVGAGLVGVVLSARWVRLLARWLPRRALAWHLAAGPCMVVGTVPAVLAWWAWRARIGSPAPDPGPRMSEGVAWEVVILASLGGLLWLAGLRCLVEGHRLLREAFRATTLVD